MKLLPMNIILLPLLLVVIVIVIKFIVPIIRPKISALISWRGSFIVASIYLGVLIMLVPILYLLPEEGFIKLGENTYQAETISQNPIADLYNQLPFKGDLDKQPGLYKKSIHTFKVTTNKLAFNGSANPGDYQIFVERKDVDDGEIEVITYIATHLAGNIDFTKLVLPPVISYENGTVTLKSANQQKLDFKHFNVDFTVAQFKNLNMGVENGMGVFFGWKVLYLRVPKGLEIEKRKYDVQIIGSN